jgi:transcription initiation factor IIF auxiliary subunit
MDTKSFWICDVSYNLLQKVEKKVKITSSNTAIKTKKKPAPTDPAWRKWKVEIMSEDGQPLSTIIDHVEYILHESFENPRIGRLNNNHSAQKFCLEV